jgi:hypothetical protein
VKWAAALERAAAGHQTQIAALQSQMEQVQITDAYMG